MTTSRRFTDLMMRMFVCGAFSTVPARGMQALPSQLADRLSPGSLRLNEPVRSVAPRRGHRDRTRQCASRRGRHRCLGRGGAHHPGPQSAGPRRHHRLLLRARLPLRLLAAAPGRRRLPGRKHDRDQQGGAGVRAARPGAGFHLDGPPGRSGPRRPGGTRSAGPAAPHRHRRMGARSPPTSCRTPCPACRAHAFRRPVRLSAADGTLYVAGDHRDTSSIQGALVSGRRAAEAVLADLGIGGPMQHPGSFCSICSRKWCELRT